MTFGSLIRKTRLSQRIKQHALAHEAGLDRASLSRIESGERGVSFHRARLLLMALGLPVSIPRTGVRVCRPRRAS